MISSSTSLDNALVSQVSQEIARLRALDNERERVHKQKMKG